MFETSGSGPIILLTVRELVLQLRELRYAGAHPQHAAAGHIRSQRAQGTANPEDAGTLGTFETTGAPGQLEAARASAGLALAGSRKTLHDMGGDIQVVSELGEGSTFTLIIPKEYSGKPLAEDAFESIAEGRKVSYRYRE